jgi:hypothetical protein
VVPQREEEEDEKGKKLSFFYPSLRDHCVFRACGGA